MQPTLKQLRYLVALADTLHFGRAAIASHVSQPALSGQIRELELMLGNRLVERTSHGAALTPVGAEVVRRGREILAAVGDLVDAAQTMGRPLCGPLRLGVIASVGPYLLPKILPDLRSRCPHLDLVLHEGLTHQLLAELLAGQLDVALVALPPPQRGLVTLPLFDDPFVLLVHESHPLAARSTVGQGELRGEPLLLLAEGHCLRDQALALCGHTEGQGGFAATSLSTVVQMVAHGYGLTLLPELCLEAELPGRPCLRLVRFVPPVPKRKLGLVSRPTSPRRADFEMLAQLIRASQKVCPHPPRSAAA
jgi:LysR family hydrogen peroxide-inducible transcriptional activator